MAQLCLLRCSLRAFTCALSQGARYSTPSDIPCANSPYISELVLVRAGAAVRGRADCYATQ